MDSLELNKNSLEETVLPETQETVEVSATTETTDVAPVEVEQTVPESEPVEAETPTDEMPADDEQSEETAVSEVAETAEEQAETSETENFVALSKAEIVEKLREIVEKPAYDTQKTEIDTLKQLFYKKKKAEKDALLAEELEPEQVELVSEADVYEIELKALLADYREKRAKIQEEENALREKNKERKEAIIEKIKQFVETPESIHEHIAEVRQLQQEWREAGALPITANANDLFKSYNLAVENFYDLLKMNFELRDYDFKKNLEAKTALCETAEKLTTETDVVVAFRSLQQLHKEWSEIGPVAKEHREPVWLRFKDASTAINKKYQSHFEIIKQEEEENLRKKIVICETIEGIDYDNLKLFKDWEAKTEEVILLQQEWKGIGFATRKMNLKIYEQYRAACDKFFAKKNEYYKAIKDEQNANLEKKRSLVSQAEKLKDSTEWGETTQKFVQLQKEWKEIGSIPRKYSDVIWKQFVAACDYFFEQKEKNFSVQKAEEKANLEKKVALIEQIENFEKTDNAAKSVAALKELIAEWRNIGHVPYRDKEKLYKRFRAACDKQFDALNVDAANRRLDSFAVKLETLTSGGNDKNKLFRERERLLKQFDRLKIEIQTCENNIGFFTTGNSKKPNALLVEMQRKIDKLKGEKDLLLSKIQLIEGQLG